MKRLIHKKKKVLALLCAAALLLAASMTAISASTMSGDNPGHVQGSSASPNGRVIQEDVAWEKNGEQYFLQKGDVIGIYDGSGSDRVSTENDACFYADENQDSLSICKNHPGHVRGSSASPNGLVIEEDITWEENGVQHSLQKGDVIGIYAGPASRDESGDVFVYNPDGN